MWTIHGNSYDLTPLLHWHPGGATILKFAYGTDCTALFESYHVFSEAPRTLLEQYGQPYAGAAADPPHAALRAAARKEFGTRDAAKTSLWSFAARAFVQVASYALMLKYPTTLNAVAHGIVTTVCYARFLHDLVHYAVAMPPLACDIAGELLSLPYFSYGTWQSGHVALHHPHTNAERDPDSRPFELQKPSVQLMFVVIAVSVWCRPPTVPYLSQTMYALTFYVVATWSHLNSYTRTRGVASVLTGGTFYVAMCCAIPEYEYLMCVATSVSFAVVSFFSSLSHLPLAASPCDVGTWSERQVRSTENYATGSALVRFFSFGLTHQIEHHLLPGISNGKLDRMSGHARALFGSAYTDNSFAVAVTRALRGVVFLAQKKKHRPIAKGTSDALSLSACGATADSHTAPRRERVVDVSKRH